MILALSLFIIALILVIVSSMTPGTSRLKKGDSPFAQGYKTAREQAASMGLPGVINPVENLTGTVLEVKNGQVTIQTELFVNKAVDGVGTMRVISLAEGGKVTLRIRKTAEEMNTAIREFQARIQNLAPEEVPPEPPMMYEDRDASMSDIKVGDTIVADDADDADLRFREALAATSIIIFKTEASE